MQLPLNEASVFEKYLFFSGIYSTYYIGSQMCSRHKMHISVSALFGILRN